MPVARARAVARASGKRSVTLDAVLEGHSLFERGKEASGLGDLDAAVECFSRLVKTYPDEPSHHWSLGMALLATGNYRQGFKEIEWRWHSSLNGNEYYRELNSRGVPRWQGESLEGKSIVVFHEWGLGDSIMMFRYIPLLKHLAKSVVVIVPKSLCRLVDGAEKIPDDHFDYRCGFYDLPSLLGVKMQSAVQMIKVVDAMTRANDATERGKHHQALRHLDDALRDVPDSPYARWDRGKALLALGKYVDGFADFEWRLALPQSNPFSSSSVPLWRGEELRGKRIVLSHEQGYGDTLMMMRYLPALKNQGAEITLLVPSSLLRVSQLFDVDARDWEELFDFSNFDYCLPMCSVVAGFGHSIKDIPSEPYLEVVGGERLPNSIGIAWSGNPAHSRDLQRSIPIDLFLSLLNCPDHSLYSVQQSGPQRGVITQKFSDFLDVAELMLRLDHIVTVDTAAAHLAGAIGHPSVHLVLPYSCDWRWYKSSVWYPKMNVYRQDSIGDWPSAFEKLKDKL